MTTTTMERTERRTCGPAWHYKVGALNVLRLEGSFYEMGRQHGVLLAEEIRSGAIPYYRTYLRNLLGRAGLGPLAPLVWGAVRALVGRRVAKAAPGFALESIRGLADGAGLPLREVMDGCFMPDALMWVAARGMRWRKSPPAVDHRMALGLGCSSAIAWGPATSDGRLLHARNTDYHGVAAWPRQAAVVFHNPGEGMRYVSCVSAGVLMGGVTAMNEAGLTLTVHQHMFTDRTTLGGTPIGVVGDVIMRKAETLDDARAILDEDTPIGCWTYLIADGKTREVLCYEVDPFRRCAIRTGPAESTFRYANIYLDPQLGATEKNLYGSYWRANQGRYERLGTRLDAGRGRHDPDAMAGILGDVGGEGCRIAKAIAMLMTVGSVVFSPEDGRFWVAAGETPTSHDRFEPFDLGREEHAPDHGTLTGGMPDDPAAAEAFDAYRRAYLAYFDERDLEGARSQIDRARSLQSAQPLYQFLAGLLALNAGSFPEAIGALDRAIELGHEHPERVATFHLWRGRARDLAGDRNGALADFAAGLACERKDPQAARALERAMKRRYRARRARRVAVDFVFADVIDP